ncbi:MerR family transcriptional regulator [Bacillus massiliglaciei]|uniref:MerR family transcriptional regulator n=1 Tax=Bacillus massiliglaciei TaxID=1816693 RepID=UPI000ADE8189|nr:MerR family transcriptional regulator [Bacillus massiliglaciei]
MKVKEVADLAGVSVRTLHHYDEIGLLRPKETTEAGYRVYSEENLETLQQILYFKELGFPLKKIMEIMDSPAFNRKEALELQHKILLEKKRRLDKMIVSIEKSIHHLKGDIHMSNQEKFEGFDFSSNPYEKEAREKWGDRAVEEANDKAKNMTVSDQEKWNQIYRNLAALRHLPPDSKEAQEGIEEWYQFLNQIGNYSLQAFKGLGEIYTDDERFTKTIDKYGEGLASFMRKAMAVYADTHQ